MPSDEEEAQDLALGTPSSALTEDSEYDYEDASEVSDTEELPAEDTVEEAPAPEVKAEPKPEVEEVPKEEPEGETETEDEGDEQPVEFTDDILQRARSVGFTDTEAKGFQNQESLESALTAMDRRFVAGIPTPLKPDDNGRPATPAVPSLIQKLDPVDLGLKSEDVDEHVISAFDKLNTHLSEKLGEMAAVVGDLITQRKTEKRQSAIQRFDNKVAALGDEWKDVFGKGASETDFHPSSKEFQNRDRLFRTAEALPLAYQDRNMPGISEDEIFQRALRAEFGDRIAGTERAKIAKTVKRRSGQVINKPKKTRKREVKGIALAKRNVARLLKEKGLTDAEAGLAGDEDEF